MSLRKSLAVAALMAAVSAVPSYADLNGSATANVFVTITSNVHVAPTTPNVNAGSQFQTGTVTAQIIFQVDANTEQVEFQVDVSALYKGDDPSNTAVAPIPVLSTAGVLVQPANGNATNGHTNVLAFQGAPTTVGLFPALPTETVTFESSQAGHFSQPVTLTVSWAQTDPELPTGEYSGVVQLTVIVVP